ncbi:hypothetical protein PIB30_074222, partial [Stylosanthes scabra]|nr:hypothetical protein [Stylosanthes scabra]
GVLKSGSKDLVVDKESSDWVKRFCGMLWDSQRVVVVCSRMEWVYAWTCPMWSARRSEGKGVSTPMRRVARICVETGLYGGMEDMMATGDMGSVPRICVGYGAYV